MVETPPKKRLESLFARIKHSRPKRECFATRNVAGAGTASSFSRVLDPWKTAIKRFISAPCCVPTFLPSFLLPSNVLSFFPCRWDACDVFLPSSFLLPLLHLSFHLSLSLSLKYPLHPCGVSTAYGYVTFISLIETSRYRGLPLPLLGGRKLAVHKDDVSKRRMFHDREGMQIRTECWFARTYCPFL